MGVNENCINSNKVVNQWVYNNQSKVKALFWHNFDLSAMEYVVDRKWKWVECNLVIKRLPQRQYPEGLYESLEAELQLMSQQPDIRNFESDIMMEKSFEFEEGKGFIWHKSWYIPEIVIKLSSRVTKMLRQQTHTKKIYCEMLSGYPFKKDEHFYLQEVKLDGDTHKQFSKKGEVVFSNIKFSETSFNKNKNKFSLIIAIYTAYKENERSIIKSYISSPIHVDSRKEARKKISANTFIQDEISLSKFTTKLEGSEKIVTNTYTYEDLLTIPGFIKYYTAANIRFKIKHPYYIGYHFHNVFDIFYNSEEAQDPVEVLQMVYENEVKENDRAKVKTKEKKDIFTDNKEILKKTSPKTLLFLIKNTPKDCYMIKDETFQSEEKIVLSDRLLVVESEEKVGVEQIKSGENPDNHEEQKSRLNGNNNQNEGVINNSEQVIKDPEAEAELAKSGLSHILTPHIRKDSKNLNHLISQQSKDNDEEYIPQDVDQNQGSKVIKQEQNSQQAQLQQLPIKIAELPEDQQATRRQQKKQQLLKQQEAIKKIYSIFESWKFNFIHLKKSDGGLTVLNKKWVYVPPQELLESFKAYTKKRSGKGTDNMRQDDGRQINGNSANSYLSYELHQVIQLQKSKNVVKVEEALEAGESG